MEVKKLCSPSKTKVQVKSQQAISGQQTDNAGETISIVPIGLRVEEKPRMDSVRDGPRSTVAPRNHPDSSRSFILIVENNQSLGAILEEALVSWGYEVWMARNGQEGLMLLATHSVDAILLDLRMPVMDGRTMLNKIRWAGYTMPVWVMSGGMEAQTLRHLLDEGAHGFLIKPFGLSALQKALTQKLGPVY